LAVTKERLIEPHHDAVKQRAAWRRDSWLTDETLGEYDRTAAGSDWRRAPPGCASPVPAIYKERIVKLRGSRKWDSAGGG
jgi:hypothetical protein